MLATAAVVAVVLASGSPPAESMVDAIAIARELAALVPDETKGAALVERIERFVESAEPKSDAPRPPIKPPPMPRAPGPVSNPDADRIGKLGADLPSAKAIEAIEAIADAAEPRRYRRNTEPPRRIGDRGDVDAEDPVEPDDEPPCGPDSLDCDYWKTSDLAILHLCLAMLDQARFTEAGRLRRAISAPTYRRMADAALTTLALRRAAGGDWRGGLEVAQRAGSDAVELTVLKAMHGRGPRDLLLANMQALSRRAGDWPQEMRLEAARLAALVGLCLPLAAIVDQVFARMDMYDALRGQLEFWGMHAAAVAVTLALGGRVDEAYSLAMQTEYPPFFSEDDIVAAHPIPESLEGPDKEEARRAFIKKHWPKRSAHGVFLAALAGEENALTLALAAARVLEYEETWCDRSLEEYNDWRIRRWCPNAKERAEHRRAWAYHLRRLSKAESEVGRPVSAMIGRARALELVAASLSAAGLAEGLLDLADTSGRRRVPIGPATLTRAGALTKKPIEAFGGEASKPPPCTDAGCLGPFRCVGKRVESPADSTE